MTEWSAVRAIGGCEGGVEVREEVLCGLEADCQSDESVVTEKGKRRRLFAPRDTARTR